MEHLAYNRFTRPSAPLCHVNGESLTEPDQALSITEIFQRSIDLLEDSPYHRQEIPDGVPDYFDDLTDEFFGEVPDNKPDIKI